MHAIGSLFFIMDIVLTGFFALGPDPVQPGLQFILLAPLTGGHFFSAFISLWIL